MAKNIYVGVNNIARKSNKIYTGVNNVSRKVTEGYIGIGGLARQFWPGTVPLSTVEVGKRVLYKSKYYTVIAKSYCVSGDVILWGETASGTSIGGYNNNTVNDTTPFGTSNTNRVTITYNRDGGSEDTRSSEAGYSWVIPAKALGYHTTYGNSEISYFSSNTQRKRSTAYNCADSSYKSEDDSYYYYVTETGGIYRTTTTKSRNVYHAYSVKGTLPCVQNSDGTYTLKI